MADTKTTALRPSHAIHTVGTAGHVDHGKSALVRALTGRDPDRLEEEKRRGLSIDLGFAWTVLDSGVEVGFVDVPGHERFISNMLAGMGGLSTAIFVVAADEGWMPQSEEHFRILELLEIPAGVIALTKIDLVDRELIAIARDEIRHRVGDEWTIVEVATPTGVGVHELRRVLDGLLAANSIALDLGRPRLWVDRVFTVHGAGTVVTGTLIGGSFRVGDNVAVAARGGMRTARIRSIQTHEQARLTALPGSRVALNLVGVDREAVQRGDAVIRPGHWWSTDRVDATIVPAGTHDAIPKGAHTLHVGSANIPIRQLTSRYGFARLRLGRAMALAPGDRFIVRDTGQHATIAGGKVLDVDPHGRFDPGRLACRDRALRDGTMLDVLLTERSFVSAGDAEALVGARTLGGTQVGRHLASGHTLDRLGIEARKLVTRYHREHREDLGLPSETLRRALDVPIDALPIVLDRAGLRADGDVVRVPERQPWSNELDARLTESGFAPPPAADLGLVPRVLRSLARDRRIVLAGPFAYRTEDFDSACHIVRAQIDACGPQTVAALRDALGITRKHALPLLEAMDEAGVTHRRGDLRS